jgi:hypothetical protein
MYSSPAACGLLKHPARLLLPPPHDHLVDRHDNVAIIEQHSRGRSKPINDSARSDLSYGKVYDTVVNRELKCKPYLSKPSIEFLDPSFETVRIESAHVADQYHVKELPNSFPLLLRLGMHLRHSIFSSRTDAESQRNTPSLHEAQSECRDKFCAGALQASHFQRSETAATAINFRARWTQPRDARCGLA